MAIRENSPEWKELERMRQDATEKYMAEVNRRRQVRKDQIFDTGSRRDSSDHKPRICDLKAYTRERFGYHMLKGSINYGTGNFEKGQPDFRTLESLHRHLTKYELGDNSEDHLSAVIFGIQNILLNEQKAGVPTDFYYQQYVASGEYDKDVARREAREKAEKL